MKKLTKENIQFIDNYLKNSDVIFDDIRMEMVDHVATAVETEISNGDLRDFYYIFKEYMVENKKQLLDNNKKFIRKSTYKVGQIMLKNTFSIKGFAVLFILSISLYFSHKFLNITSLYRVLGYTPFLLILLTFFGIKLYKVNRKPLKFSAINQLSIYAVAIYQIYNFLFNPFFFNVDKELAYGNISLVGLIVLLFIACVFMLTAFQLSNYYTKKYQKILDC